MIKEGQTQHSKYRMVSFMTSATMLRQCPPDEGSEVAFVGRSNAGKSSVINTLCEQTKLVKVAKTPGQTQMLNFFSVSEEQRLLDMPGYGYASVPQKVRDHWQKLLPKYFETRYSLKGVVMVLDIRRQVTKYDWKMLSFCRNLPLHLVLTKADKCNRAECEKARKEVYKAVSNTPIKFRSTSIEVQLFSSKARTGIEALRAKLDAWLDPPTTLGEQDKQ